jgi:LytS/YehU family sensor histidine kinase
VLVHVPASLLVSLVQVAGHTVADMGFIHGHFAPASLWDGFTALFARTYHFGLLVYWGIVAVHQAVAHFREQELRASRLEAELARAELQALRRQLHPHFLFNTLNAISALMHRDVKAADLMLARLSEFLRTAIESDGAQEVALGRELELLERYLEIEKVRFRDRLTVRMDVAPDALSARVPSLVLQPLVENSIRHGIGNRRGAGVLEVRAVRDDGSLRLSVRDNGVGMSDAAVEGVGLSNTRARLEQLYGPHHTFELRNIPEGGLEVTLAIPFRPAGDDDDGPDSRDHR